jgi:hypothetical protein
LNFLIFSNFPLVEITELFIIHITLASFSFILKRRRIKRAPGFPFCCLSLSSSYSLYCLLHLFPVIANRSREHHTMEQTSVVVV